MRRPIRLLGVVIFLSLMFTGSIIFGQPTTQDKPLKPPPQTAPPQPPVQKCCIMGEYKGYREDIPSKTCPEPKRGDFEMIIYQDKGCGSKIWGKVTGGGGTPNDFTGMVTPGEKGCCNISGGGWSKPPSPGFPGERVDFKGILCKKGGKWTGRGDYRSTKETIVCTGKWSMTQM